MYIKVIHKNDKTYYILCVCDASTNEWSNRFIAEEVAYSLVDNGVKVIEK